MWKVVRLLQTAVLRIIVLRWKVILLSKAAKEVADGLRALFPL
jgi:hypothetical protein